MIYIGIDNGITGGMVALSDHPGPPIGMTTMPVQKHRTRNELDIRAIHFWLDDVTDGNIHDTTFIIEEPNNSRNASTAYSVASSFHSFRGFFEAKLLRFVRITPQSWQKHMLGKVPKGETKAHALAMARKLWSSETWMASPRCTTPHPGLVDAALIAEYGRMKSL
jgi:hypothetical protein